MSISITSQREKARERDKHTPPPKLIPKLLKQVQYSGRQLVGLSQNRGRSLLQGLLLGQLSGFSCEVGVLYATLCSGHVLSHVLQNGDGAGQTVLRSTEVGTGSTDGGDCSVDRGDRVVDVGGSGGAGSTGQNQSTAVHGQADGVELGAQGQADLVGRTGVGTHLQGNHASRTVQQELAVDLGARGDTSQFVRHLGEFGVGCGLVGGAVGTVTGLNSQFTHTLQNVGVGCHRAVSGLSQGDTVVGVLDRNGLTADLAAHTSGDPQAGGVVRGAVDFQAGRQALHGGGESVGRVIQVLLNRQGSNVGVYTQRHDEILVGWVLRLPALASAGYGLENLRNSYRRDCKLLEGFFQKFCHHPATPLKTRAWRPAPEGKMTSGNCHQLQQPHQFVLHPVGQPQPVLGFLANQHSGQQLRPLLPNLPRRARQRQLRGVEHLDHVQGRLHITTQTKQPGAFAGILDTLRQPAHWTNSWSNPVPTICAPALLLLRNATCGWRAI